MIFFYYFRRRSNRFGQLYKWNFFKAEIGAKSFWSVGWFFDNFYSPHYTIWILWLFEQNFFVKRNSFVLMLKNKFYIHTPQVGTYVLHYYFRFFGNFKGFFPLTNWKLANFARNIVSKMSRCDKTSTCHSIEDLQEHAFHNNFGQPYTVYSLN